MVALVRDPPRARDPRRARTELERVGSVEPRLEQRLESRLFGLDLDHVDRAVGAGLCARGASGARRLVDHDLFLDRIESDRIVCARIDAALIGTSPAGVYEVEHAELIAAEREPPSAIALLTRLLAQLA